MVASLQKPDATLWTDGNWKSKDRFPDKEWHLLHLIHTKLANVSEVWGGLFLRLNYSINA